MSSQSYEVPGFTPDEIIAMRRARAAESSDPDTGKTPHRPRSHGRNNGITHHKGQVQEVHGGRTAKKHQDQTDGTRNAGRATPWAAEVLKEANYGSIRGEEQPEVVAAQIDPRRAEPLPPDHPEVLKEIKRDRIEALMQPGSDNELDQSLSSGIEGYDDDDDWIS